MPTVESGALHSKPLDVVDPSKPGPLHKLPVVDTKSSSITLGPPTPKSVASSTPTNLEGKEHPEQISDKVDKAEIIDMETFQQILDLDEDDMEFSRGMAWAYFSQAEATFIEMDEAVADKDLPRLSSLGHFLKGSSAALGVSKVQASCEKIQHYGQLRDEEEDKDLTDVSALAKIGQLLGQVKEEYRVAEQWLRKWYSDNEEKP